MDFLWEIIVLNVTLHWGIKWEQMDDPVSLCLKSKLINMVCSHFSMLLCSSLAVCIALHYLRLWTGYAVSVLGTCSVLVLNGKVLPLLACWWLAPTALDKQAEKGWMRGGEERPAAYCYSCLPAQLLHCSGRQVREQALLVVTLPATFCEKAPYSTQPLTLLKVK